MGVAGMALVIKPRQRCKNIHLEAVLDTGFCCGSRAQEAASSPNNELTVHPSSERDATAVLNTLVKAELGATVGAWGREAAEDERPSTSTSAHRKARRQFPPPEIYTQNLHSLYKVLPLRSLLCRADGKVAGVETPFSLTTTV